jgi:hypothetical protein
MLYVTNDSDIKKTIKTLTTPESSVPPLKNLFSGSRVVSADRQTEMEKLTGSIVVTSLGA